MLPKILEFSKKEIADISQYLENCINKLKMIECLEMRSDFHTHHHSNRKFVANTLLVLNEELKSCGTYQLVKEIINRENSKFTELQNSFNELKLLTCEIDNWQKQLSECKEKYRLKLNQQSDVLDEQAVQLQNLIDANNSELQFEKEWLRVQIEENELRFELKEKDLKQRLININKDIEEEEKVHSEIIWYYEKEEERVNNQISYWQERFQDTEEREIELKILTDKQRNLYCMLQKQKSLYNARKEEMEAYLSDKQRRRDEYEYQQFLHQKATVIEAWWRGVMVRKYLGPYSYLKSKYIRKRKFSLKRNKK